MNSDVEKRYDSIAGNSFWRMTALIVIITAAMAGLLFYATQQYVISQAENKIQDLLFAHNGIHQYVQQVMHPAFYKYKGEGKIEEDFYAPELLSSSFIVRNQHQFYNEERVASGMPELYYKMAAINPRNPVNKADAREERLIRMFNEKKDVKKYREIIEIDDKKYLYVALPFLENQERCIKCHGKREDSPVQLQERYKGQGGFNEKVGDIRAVISIRAPLEREYFNTYIIFATLFAGLLSIVSLFLFNQRLRTMVWKRTILLEQEVVERKRAEENLAEEKEQLSVTLRSIGDGVITTDISGNVVLLNKVAEKLTGWSNEEAAGLPLGDVFHIINEHTRVVCENPVTKVMNSGQIVGLANHTVLVAKDGTERSIADSGAPIRDARSSIIGVVLVFRDVTEQARTEKELLKVKKLESVGILAGGIAHDFNNILAAILGNINLALYDTELKDGTKELLTAAEKASIRAKDLTQQLLTFAKGGEPVKETASLESIIKESANFILHGDKVACQYDIADDLWLVDIDKGQIGQVIQNIVLNASHAMPEGGVIRITAENIFSAEKMKMAVREGRFVKIAVRDSGIGMPANVVEKIFDPYFSTKQTGSGLGLAISQSIISKHEGDISVESSPGVGSIFTIYLPAAGIAAVKNEGISKENKGDLSARILLMDDEEMVRAVAQKMLVRLGHEVVLAADGEEAVKLYQEAMGAGNRFDLVIMDLTIPGGMGGQEAVQEVIKINPQARVLVSSGYSNDPVMANYKDYGFCAAIVKPFQLSDLENAIRQAVH